MLDFEKFRNYFSSLNAFEQAGFFLWPSVKSYKLSKEERESFLAIKPSGVLLFKKNFSDFDQAKNLISEIRSCSLKNNADLDKNFIVSVDEEGGRVTRLPLDIKTKPVLEFTQAHDKEGLRTQTLHQAHIAHKLSVNCFLAPVLDIFTEPQNTVIGDRSFGYTAEDVCEYANVVFDVLEEQHIFSCGKHFPGHGNTKADSHVDCAVSHASKELLEKREWLPFIHLIKKNIPMIMAAHVIVPSLSPRDLTIPRELDPAVTPRDDVPSTLNYHILTEVLRHELGFEGLIISDCLRMGAIKKFYESQITTEPCLQRQSHLRQRDNIDKPYISYACIDALLAGCDILLSSDGITEDKIIIDSISEKMQNDSDFFDLCCEKAYRQIKLLSSHFDSRGAFGPDGKITSAEGRRRSLSGKMPKRKNA